MGRLRGVRPRSIVKPLEGGPATARRAVAGDAPYFGTVTFTDPVAILLDASVHATEIV